MQRLDRDLPRIIGVESVKVVKQNFINQSYNTGAGSVGWEARSSKTNRAYDRRGQYRGSVYNSANKLLLQTRNLYNSIAYTVNGKSVTVGVNQSLVPYAKRMNQGGGGVPARQFMPKPGDPPNIAILQRVKRKIEFERNKAMAPFR